jgi:hypothetical protein
MDAQNGTTHDQIISWITLQPTVGYRGCETLLPGGAVDLSGQSHFLGPVNAVAGMWHRIYLPLVVR